MKTRGQSQALPEIEAFLADLPAFRGSVDAMLRNALISPEDWMRCFLNLLVACAQLYLTCARLRVSAPVLRENSSKVRGADQISVKIDPLRQRKLRRKIERRLRSAVPWVAFCPENEFSRWTGLWDRDDYINNIAYNLSDIYEATIPAEFYVSRFKDGRGDQALAEMLVGAEFMAMHYLPTAITTLQWASDDGSWMDLAEAKGQQQRMQRSARKRGGSKEGAARVADAFAASRRASRLAMDHKSRT